jgi:hypothetical protein
VRTATDAFAATRRVAAGRGRRRVGAVAALLALTITGGLFAMARGRHAGRADAPSAPAHAQTTPAHDVSTVAPAGHNVEPHPALSVPVATANVASSARGSDKGTPRRGGRARPPRAVALPARPSAESRLHAWDPDSPVPP